MHDQRSDLCRRKSAVELLQETKAFYVKSESVLDNKQEFKNAEHLHVTTSPQSPTFNMSLGHSYRDRGGPPSAPPTMSNFPYTMFTYTCGTCPPYPHEHLDHLHLMHSNYLNSIKREKHHHQSHHKSSKHSSNSNTNHYSQPPKIVDGTKSNNFGENWGEYVEKKTKHFSSSSGKRNSAAPQPAPPPGIAQPIPRKELASNHSSGSGSGKSHSSAPKIAPAGMVVPTLVSNGEMCPPTTTGTMTFTSFSQSGSLYSSLEKHVTANLPIVNLKPNQGKVRKDDHGESDSPPPLPPKSPRTSSKPSRPSDFPQRLNQILPPPVAVLEQITNHIILPPPPPRKNRHKSGENTGTVIRRSQARNSSSSTTDATVQPMTLPSPILPPTPPDVVMESPMSDSGPIISPPPAFSTPVTPMLDRQGSCVSDRSVKTFGASTTTPPISAQLAKVPLSAAVSMSGVSSISSRSQSHGDDVSMNNSPLDRSRSRLSSSSPMSHQDMENNSASHPVSVSRRPSESASNSVFNSNVSIAQNTSRSNSNTASPSEEENNGDESEEGGISGDDVDGDDDDSSRAADDNVQHYLSVSSNTKQLSRNNSRKSATSADGVTSTTSPYTSLGVREKSPSRGQSKISSTLSSGEMGKKSGDRMSSISFSKGAGESSKSGKLSKSITSLCRATTSQQSELQNPEGNHYMEVGQSLSMSHASKPARNASPPVRRPSLSRSKSDIGRYMKASRSATLTPGFTLVHVDLGPPPPVPLHSSVSTSDFPSATTAHASLGKSSLYHQAPQPKHQHHHSHQHHQSHYQQLSHPTYAHAYHTLQPSSHYSQGHNISHHHNSLLSTYQQPHIYARPSSSTYENLVLQGGKAELDRFFDQLGLDNKIDSLSPFSPQLHTHHAKGKEGDATKGDDDESPVFFSSVSSVDSCARRSGSGDSEDSPVQPGGKPCQNSKTVSGAPPNNNQAYGNNNHNATTLVVHHGEPSIVERNARVIKWLYSIRHKTN
ncbi:hypothetical protein Fcan01_02949 [Folsomia candida]|uniref:Centrosome-associated FAM110 C-terminal domain-containing protein n=1 Tax=Folsomia candida TaxID=158441 RepID=A0A226F6D5_FOLCA|nr:hypothetical protein Fcan01_02949 [Folsomia candida]